MPEVTLEFLGTQMERLLGEFANMRREFADMRVAITDLSVGQTALAERIFGAQRDMVGIKDILVHIDVRLSELEEGRAEER